jgi:YD repeat-containing protein
MIQRMMQLAGLLLLLNSFTVFAQPADEYVKTMNSLVPVSPEAAQIMKYVDYPVTLYTGTPQIALPVFTVTGSGMSLPIVLSYHAGGGIKIDEIPGNVGLGWSIAAGGEITREVRGMADDNTGYGLLQNTHPVSYYLDHPDESYNAVYEAAHNRMDLEPDMQYFSFGNYSGKFIYDDETGKYRCVDEKPYVINFDRNNKNWNITVDDGTTYYFNHEVKTSSSSDCNSATGSWSLAVTTSWKLSKIINADRTDSIMFNYNYRGYKYYSSGSSTLYHFLSGMGSVTLATRPPLNCFTNNNITGFTELQSIVSSNDSVVFIPEATDRLDMQFGRALSQVVIKTRDGIVKDIFKFNYDYFSRPSVLGNLPDVSRNNKSLKLTELINYGNALSNTNPLTHKFTYNSTPLPCRLSYSQDFWGYANGASPVLGVLPTLVPPRIYNNNGYQLSYEGADRNPDTAKMKAALLEKIEFPTGGYTLFNYEPNTIGYPSEFTTSPAIDVSKSLWGFIDLDSALFTSAAYTATFTINQPTDPIINNSNVYGGITADVFVDPGIPGWHLPNAIIANKCKFQLDVVSNTPGDPNVSYMLQGPVHNIHLPNGTCTLKAFVSPLNQRVSGGEFPDEGFRSFSMSVNYKMLDSTISTNLNYFAAGVRIKSIEAVDNMTQKSSTREFLYHNPVTDSSYGLLASPVNSYFIERDLSQNSEVLVRMGNCIMPGNNAAGSAILYPKVTEQVKDGDKYYKTFYTYYVAPPAYSNSFPFAPPFDFETRRGNLLESTVMKQDGITYLPQRKQVNVYDLDPVTISSGYPIPVSLPGSQLAKPIWAIKAQFDSYSNGISMGYSNLPLLQPCITLYANNISRVYLQSDTTIEYNEGGTPALKNWNGYLYGDYNQKPIQVTSRDSKGASLVQRFGYANDAGEPALSSVTAMATPLTAANRVSDVLASRQYKDGQMLSQSFNRGHFAGSRFLIDSVLQAEYNNPLEWDVKVVDYDDLAHPLTVQGRGNMFRKYIWRKEKNLALATCTMPKNGAFVFTSFEYPNEYSTVNDVYRQSASAFSGKYSYYLNGYLNFPGFDAVSGIEVYAWVNQGAFAANSILATSTGRTKGDWTLYKVSIPAAATVSISGTVVMDQLIIVPAGSVFEANIYDEANRVSAKVNQNMQTTFFEYDGFSRLQNVRDEKGNILKSNNYNYQVAE